MDEGVPVMVASMFDFLALVWLLIGDVMAFFALFGAALTLLIAIFDAWRGRSPLRAFKVTADWSIGALFLGLLLFGSVMLSSQVDVPTTFFFKISRLNVAFMLAAAVAMLITSLVVSRLIRRRVTPHPIR
jgi:hypothetical protein